MILHFIFKCVIYLLFPPLSDDLCFLRQHKFILYFLFVFVHFVCMTYYMEHIVYIVFIVHSLFFPTTFMFWVSFSPLTASTLIAGTPFFRPPRRPRNAVVIVVVSLLSEPLQRRSRHNLPPPWGKPGALVEDSQRQTDREHPHPTTPENDTLRL